MTLRRHKPMGQNIREVCEIVQEHGPMHPCEVYPHSVITFGIVRTCLSRAVRYGLMTRGERGVYLIEPGWRDRLNDKPTEQERPRVARVNSVFQLGSRCE